MSKLELQFDPSLLHQLHAVRSVVDILEGFERHKEVSNFGEEIIPNIDLYDSLDPMWLQEQLQAIQRQNNAEKAGAPLDESLFLDIDSGMVLEGAGVDSVEAPHFTVEMETGTGKTYVYFRTIRELYKRYGFRKFVIVVPSIAIFEGVKKTFDITKNHFAGLYGNDPANLIEYDGSQLGRIREFANNQFLSILLITKQAFDKASNNFYKPTEKLAGELMPYQYVQQTRPIVILDEPQNMSSERAKEQIRTLKPLFVLRYSATHRDTPNLVYRLTPVDAFKEGLVKQIEVVGISELELASAHNLSLEAVTRNSPLMAKVRTTVLKDGKVSEDLLTLRQNDDLFKKTGLESHRGKVVENIVMGTRGKPSVVEFTDGTELSTDEDLGSRAAIFRAQIEKTIETHMQRQDKLKKFGIKVLSLFFIDRVAYYIDNDGLIKGLFDESFDKYKKRHPDFAKYEAREVREGYFAKKKNSKTGEETYLDDISRAAEQEAAKEAFNLIMRKKERLLAFEEPVSFIFAHSALKEGWDNPNVFQICTLNNTVSNMKKRQEIGRGLRLCVDQTGQRPEGFIYNLLTVVANESYERYVETLQNEYLEDGDAAPPKPSTPQKGETKHREHLYNSDEFRAFWKKLCQRLSYRITVDTDALVEACIKRLNSITFPEPRLQISQGRFIMKDYKLRISTVSGDMAFIQFESSDTQGNEERHRFAVKEGQDLYKDLGLNDFRGFKVLRIYKQYGEDYLEFDNGCQISQSEVLHHRVQHAHAAATRERRVVNENRPVPDFIGRVAANTNLTRATVLKVFKSMDEGRKAKLFKNPEGWANVFSKVIEETVADHIAERLEFHSEHTSPLDVEEVFPEVVKMPQRELIESGTKGLYDRVQIDSGEEELFVSNSLYEDEENVVLFFKFPPRFKIGLPKIIGNYNPDWGIVRRSKDDRFTVQLIRETKGTEDEARLRFSHEQRKITAARKYFSALGIDYRVVTSRTPRYWQAEDHAVSR